MTDSEDRKDRKEARFPVIVLAISMLAPIVLAIGLILWKTSVDPLLTGRPVDSTLSDEVPAGHIRLTVTAPGMMRGKIRVSRLDETGEKAKTLELEVKSGLARGDLALGDPAFEILIECDDYLAKRLRADLKRLTVLLEEN